MTAIFSVLLLTLVTSTAAANGATTMPEGVPTIESCTSTVAAATVWTDNTILEQISQTIRSRASFFVAGAVPRGGATTFENKMPSIATPRGSVTDTCDAGSPPAFPRTSRSLGTATFSTREFNGCATFVSNFSSAPFPGANPTEPFSAEAPGMEAVSAEACTGYLGSMAGSSTVGFLEQDETDPPASASTAEGKLLVGPASLAADAAAPIIPSKPCSTEPTSALPTTDREASFAAVSDSLNVGGRFTAQNSFLKQVPPTSTPTPAAAIHMAATEQLTSTSATTTSVTSTSTVASTSTSTSTTAATTTTPSTTPSKTSTSTLTATTTTPNVVIEVCTAHTTGHVVLHGSLGCDSGFGTVLSNIHGDSSAEMGLLMNATTEDNVEAAAASCSTTTSTSSSTATKPTCTTPTGTATSTTTTASTTHTSTTKTQTTTTTSRTDTSTSASGTSTTLDAASLYLPAAAPMSATGQLVELAVEADVPLANGFSADAIGLASTTTKKTPTVPCLLCDLLQLEAVGAVPLTKALYAEIASGAKESKIVTSIPAYEFNEYAGSITLGPTPLLESVGLFAFYRMKGVLTLQLGDCGKLTKIEYNAFNNAGNAASVISIGATPLLESIGRNAFIVLKGVLTLRLGDCGKLSKIGDNAFYNLESGADSVISIGATPLLQSVGKEAFINMRGVLTLQLGDCGQLTKIGESAFSSVGNAAVVSIGATPLLESVGGNAFRSMKGVLTLQFGDCRQLSKIEAGAFSYLTNAASAISIGATPLLQSVGSSAFSYMEGVLTLQLGDCAKLTKVWGGAFQYVANAASVVSIGATPVLQSVGGIAFRYMKGVLTLQLGDCVQLTNIGEGAFYSLANAASFVSIGVAPLLQSIEDNTFYSMQGVLAINVGACPNLVSIGKEAFSN
eukprot:gene20141-3422_t